MIHDDSTIDPSTASEPDTHRWRRMVTENGYQSPVKTEERYRIAINAGGKFIAATLTGDWTSDIVDQYKRDLLAAGSQLIAIGVNAKEIGILIDTRHFGPQSQEVATYYVAAFGEKHFGSARIAVLYASTLQKMQVRRMAVGKPHFFENLVDAVNWLTGSGS